MQQTRFLLTAGWLMLWAAAIGLAASRLAYAGAPAVALAALVLAAAAVALPWRPLWACAFAFVFCAVAGLALLGAATIAGLEAVSGVRRSATLETLLWGAVCLVFFLAGAASVACAVRVGRFLVASAKPHSPAAWLAAVAVGVALAVLVVVTVGDRYLARQLWKQNDCHAGVALACYELAHSGPAPRSARSPRSGVDSAWPDIDWARFTPAERAAFSQRGCVAGRSGSCSDLAFAIDAGTIALGTAEGAAASDVLAAQCSSGDAKVCTELARVLYRAGAPARAESPLLHACDASLTWCAQAARTAADHGANDLQRTLYQHGCDRDDAASCRGLLVRHLLDDDAAARASMERKTCLIGDVNDCLPGIRRDMRTVCPLICAGSTALRAQSCRECARVARESGLGELADGWLAQACATGYRSDCNVIATDRPARPRR